MESKEIRAYKGLSARFMIDGFVFLITSDTLVELEIISKRIMPDSSLDREMVKKTLVISANEFEDPV